MKKEFLFAAITVILLTSIFYYLSLPDYLIFNSTTFSNGSNRHTELQVIVYRYDSADRLVKKIEKEHNQINNAPSVLKINLYHSKWSFRNGYEPFYTATINYNQRIHTTPDFPRTEFDYTATGNYRSRTYTGWCDPASPGTLP